MSDGMKSVQHLSRISENDLWETPRQMLRDACEKYNVHPVLDVAASLDNRKYRQHFSTRIDALTVQWRHDFFMNPPYSRVAEFMRKAYRSHVDYNVTGLILVFAKTDTHWWHDYVEDKAEVHFIEGRVQFLLNGVLPRYCSKCKTTSQTESRICGEGHPMRPNSAPYPSVWIIYRSKK